MVFSSRCQLDRRGSPLIVIEPIGVIHTPFQRKYDAPRQPGVDADSDLSIVRLHPQRNYEQALDDLDGCERIWLVVWFDRVSGWKPKVLPPRGRTKRGVFATRSPHRPNPIGLTCCELVCIKGLEVTVRGTDLLDGTPVVDIKPYIAYADAFPESGVRWMDELGDLRYSVEHPNVSELPAEVTAYVHRILSVDPFPHPYRRIVKEDNGVYVIAVGVFRVRYTVQGYNVCILDYRVVL